MLVRNVCWSSVMFATSISVPAMAGWQEDAVYKTNVEVAEIEVVASLLVAKSLQCTDVRVLTANNHLEAQVDRLGQATNMALSSRSGAGTRYIGQKTMDSIKPMVSEARFTLADALMAASSLDEADKIYRSTISTFVGSTYEAMRQRALIGIDDVRAKRASRG